MKTKQKAAEFTIYLPHFTPVLHAAPGTVLSAYLRLSSLFLSSFMLSLLPVPLSSPRLDLLLSALSSFFLFIFIYLGCIEVHGCTDEQRYFIVYALWARPKLGRFTRKGFYPLSCPPLPSLPPLPLLPLSPLIFFSSLFL